MRKLDASFWNIVRTGAILGLQAALLGSSLLALLLFYLAFFSMIGSSVSSLVELIFSILGICFMAGVGALMLSAIPAALCGVALALLLNQRIFRDYLTTGTGLATGMLVGGSGGALFMLLVGAVCSELLGFELPTLHYIIGTLVASLMGGLVGLGLGQDHIRQVSKDVDTVGTAFRKLVLLGQNRGVQASLIGYIYVLISMSLYLYSLFFDHSSTLIAVQSVALGLFFIGVAIIVAAFFIIPSGVCGIALGLFLNMGLVNGFLTVRRGQATGLVAGCLVGVLPILLVQFVSFILRDNLSLVALPYVAIYGFVALLRGGWAGTELAKDIFVLKMEKIA